MEKAKKVIIYCDEAGNSGPNYLEQAQPFYVLASWVIPYDMLADVAAAIELCRLRYCAQSQELKASNLIKSAGGKRAIIDLIKTFGKIGCIPVFELLEKRYCIAGKVVETFLDPAYNSKVSNAFIPDSTTKREIADTLFNVLPEGVLNNFALAYRNPSVKDFERSLKEIVTFLRGNSCIELGNIIEGSLLHIDELLVAESGKPFFGNMQESINFPAYSDMLMMIEALGRLNLFEPVKIVHDEIHAYQEGFLRVFSLLKNAKEGVFAFPNGAHLLFPLRCIPHIEFAASHDNSIIQAADVLASSINYLSKLAFQSKPITDVDVELSSLIFPALLCDVPRIAWCVGSDQFLGLLADCFMKPFAQKLPKSKTITAKKMPIHYNDKPLLPLSVPANKNDTSQRFAIPLPVYGLLGDQSKSLMIINGLDIENHPDEKVVPLFSSKEQGTAFIQLWKDIAEFTENQTIHSYGPGDVGNLIGDIEIAQHHATIVAFDLCTEAPALMPLNAFILDLKSMMNRVLRAISSGIYKEIFQLHELDGKKIMSYLAADGSYLAAIHPNGEFCTGSTREQAVEAVKKKLGDTRKNVL